MKHIIFLNICLLLNFNSISQIRDISFEKNPFVFSNPRESDFFHFTTNDLVKLREHYIDVVSLRSCSWKNDSIIEYIFNEKYYLSNVLFYENKKGESTVVQNVRYNVDSSYRLIAKENKRLGVSISYDSMAYDNLGRLIYKELKHKTWSKKKKEYLLDSTFIMEMIQTNENGVVLLSKSDNSKTFINNKNEIYRFESKERIDSLSVEIIEGDKSIKSYWFKNVNDSIFKIGLRQSFVNDKLVKETIYWDPLRGEEAYMYYVYNEENQLVLSYLNFIHFDSPQEKQIYIYSGERLQQYTYLGRDYNSCLDFGYYCHLILD